MPTNADEFTAFVHGHGRRLQRFGYLLTGDVAAAEDLVQSALLQVLPRWERIENREGVEAYVRRVMVNKQREGWRKRSSRESLRPEPPVVSVADETGTVDERDQLRRALGALPARQRAAVILRFYEDMSEAETARVLDCSVGNVKSQTSRGLTKLRELLIAPIEGAAHVAH